MSKRTIFLVALLILTTALITADDNKKTVKPADSITLQELKDHMFFLASDELEGRYVGSEGFKIAA